MLLFASTLLHWSGLHTHLPPTTFLPSGSLVKINVLFSFSDSISSSIALLDHSVDLGEVTASLKGK